MSRHETSLAHAARIRRVVDHVAGHLDDVLDLEELAAIACYSPWHFHRVYVAATGETVASTLRRLRLHRAAVQLNAGDRPISWVARRAGYGSVAAFTRAFAARYGQPPAAWRRRGHALRLEQPGEDIMSNAVPSRLPEIAYDVVVVDTPPIPVIALDHRGSYQEIGHTFEKLFLWAGSTGPTGPDTRMLGIYYDDPASRPIAELRSCACITAPPSVGPGPGMHREVIAGGPVARLVHKGPYADLDVAYAWLYRTWLPLSGREPGEAPCFEEYLNDPASLPPTEWLTAVNLPLKP